MAIKSKTKVIDLTQGVRDKVVIENGALKIETASIIERDMIGIMSSNSERGFTLSTGYGNSLNAYKAFDGYSSSATVYLASTFANYPGYFDITSESPKTLIRWSIEKGAGAYREAPSGFFIYGYRADTGEKIKLVDQYTSNWTNSNATEVRSIDIPVELQVPCTRWTMERAGNENPSTSVYTVRVSEFTLIEKATTYQGGGSYTSKMIDLGEQVKQITSISVSGTYTPSVTTTVAYSNDGVTFGAFGPPTASKGRYAIVKAAMTRYSETVTPTITSLSLNYQVEDRYVIKDGLDYKAYVAGAWSSLGQTIDRALLITQGMTDLSVIPKAAWQSLSTPEIICLSEDVNAVRSSRVTGVKKPYVVLTASDLDVRILKRLSVLSQVTNSGIIRLFVSQDSGSTWIGKRPLDVTNNASIEANAYSPEEFNALTDAQWRSLSSTGKLKIGFYFNRMASTDFASIDSLSRENYSYDNAPTTTTGQIDYKTTTKTVPDFYVSRDDGVTWKKVSLDEMISIKDLPVGKNVRLKIDLKSGQVLQALAYSWN